MSITSYDTLNNLAEISFIAGSDKTLTFTCYESDGITPLNINNGSVTWKLCPYGEFNIISLEKTGTIISTYNFTIKLSGNDTIGLSGKYIQQPTVIDSTGNTFLPGQGIIIILPAISTT